MPRAILCLVFSLFLPVASYAADVRDIAAQQDEAAIIQALEMVYLDTGYYTSIENLDDLASTTSQPYNNINDGGGMLALEMSTANWRAARVPMSGLFGGWMGPYIAVQPQKISVDGAGYDPGTFLDPWGNPYYLFTPAGLARPTTKSITLDLYGDAFDRFTIVSLGADGVVSSDDVMRQFGSAPTQMMITSLRPATAARGANVTVHGYNLGSSASGKAILSNGSPVPNIVSWSPTQIVFTVPQNAYDGPIQVQIGAVKSNAMDLHLLTRTTRQWTMYE